MILLKKCGAGELQELFHAGDRTTGETLKRLSEPLSAMTLYGAVQTYIDGKHSRGVVFEEAAKILRPCVPMSEEIGDVL